MQKLFTSIAFMLFTSLLTFKNAKAQTSDKVPVKWTCNVSKNADNVNTLFVKASIDKGYHIFSGKPGDEDGFLIPTTIEIEIGAAPANVIKIPITDRHANKKPIQAKMEGIGTVNFYEKEVVYSIPFEVVGNNSNAVVNITYQCCNDKMCLPPVDLSLPIK
jgi:hypothetical protein